MSIGSNEILANRLDVVDDEQFESVALDSLRKVHENLVVVLKSLAVRKDDLSVDVLFRDLATIGVQKGLFDLVESLLIQRLTSHEVQTLASQTTILGREQTLK